MAFNKIEVQNGALGNGLVQFELISLNSGLVMRFQELNPRHSSSMMSMCIPLRALLLQWLLPLVLGESIPFLHSILTINWASLTMRTIMTMTLGLFRMACQKTMWNQDLPPVHSVYFTLSRTCDVWTPMGICPLSFVTRRWCPSMAVMGSHAFPSLNISEMSVWVVWDDVN